MRIVSIIGAITCFVENDPTILKNVSTFVGSSAGAVSCFFLCCDVHVFRMKQILFDAIEEMGNTSINIDNIFNVYNTLGIDDAKILKNALQKVILEKFNVSDINFIDFAKLTGKNLVITVSNISKSKCEFWCVDTAPGQSVVDAIMASCAIPIVCRPFIRDGNIYCDGAVYNYFPIDYFSPHELQDTLGICLESTSTSANTLNKKQDLNLLSFILLLVNSSINVINRMNICPYERSKNNVVLDIKTDDDVETCFNFRLMKYSISQSQFNVLFESGYNQALTFFSQYKHDSDKDEDESTLCSEQQIVVDQ